MKKEKVVLPMQGHTELINYLSDKIEARNYLEIGVYNTEHNFDRIKIINKLGIDPDIKNNISVYEGTSDEYFTGYPDRKFDIIFIDGLHHADQVKKDFDNSLRCLTDKGYIILHDCNPHSEAITHVPRDNREWSGDVYKFVSTLGSYSGIDFLTVDMDYGCCVVWKDKKSIGYEIPEITWEYFTENKQKLLRLVDVEMFKMLMGHKALV